MDVKPAPTIRFVLPGVVGEPTVLKALLGPETDVKQMTIEGYEERRQPKPPPHVWEVMKNFWDEATPPKKFRGSHTLVENAGSTAQVSYIDFASPADFQKATEMLSFWSFHDPKKPTGDDAQWYKYHKIKQDGNMIYVTEMINADPETLEPVTEEYKKSPEYLQFRDDMAEQAADPVSREIAHNLELERRAKKDTTLKDPEVNPSTPSKLEQE